MQPFADARRCQAALQVDLVRIEVRRLDGLMLLTIPHGVYVIHQLTVTTFRCGGSIRGRLR